MLKFFRPHYYVKHVLELPAERLRALGIDGLLLDLDGTLKDYRSEEVTGEILGWLRELQRQGLGLCLLSNGKSGRIGRVARALGVPFVAQAFKPAPFGCHRALGLLGLDRSRVAIVGDQVFADVLAGRLAGLRTILVPPLHDLADEPWFTRIKRPFERLVLRGL
jgi:HAD superfamily phosphatase (TIGR01668 family)